MYITKLIAIIAYWRFLCLLSLIFNQYDDSLESEPHQSVVAIMGNVQISGAYIDGCNGWLLSVRFNLQNDIFSIIFIPFDCHMY